MAGPTARGPRIGEPSVIHAAWRAPEASSRPRRLASAAYGGHERQVPEVTGISGIRSHQRSGRSRRGAERVAEVVEWLCYPRCRGGLGLISKSERVDAWAPLPRDHLRPRAGSTLDDQWTRAIVEGALADSGCRVAYPIRPGIPRFAIESLAATDDPTRKLSVRTGRCYTHLSLGAQGAAHGVEVRAAEVEYFLSAWAHHRISYRAVRWSTPAAATAGCLPP